MKKLISIFILSLFTITSIAAVNGTILQVEGRLADLNVRSFIDQVTAYHNDESLDIYFQINLESVAVELENQDTGEVIYTNRVNTYSVKNITIDLTDLEDGQYKIQFTNLQSGDTMYGVFRTGM